MPFSLIATSTRPSVLDPISKWIAVFMAATLLTRARGIIPLLADFPPLYASEQSRGFDGAHNARVIEPSVSSTEPLARFARASLGRAIWQLANTLPPFLALWAAMAWIFHARHNYLWVLLVALPAAALYLRLFIIQHDCGHGSFFRSARANRWLGGSLGVITLFPFAYWKKTHAVHHATSGNLDKRVLGDIRTFTVREYAVRSTWIRFCYRFYRSMPVMLGLGPFFQFVVKHRLPIGMPWNWKKEWRSVAVNNLVLLALGLCWAPGWAGPRCSRFTCPSC